MEEFERALDRGELKAIVVHPLGLDYCKDRGLPADGTMLGLRRLTAAAALPFLALRTEPFRLETSCPPTTCEHATGSTPLRDYIKVILSTKV